MIEKTFRQFDHGLAAIGKRPLLADLRPALPADEVSTLLGELDPAPHGDIATWFGLHDGGSASSTRWQLLTLAEAIEHRVAELGREDSTFEIGFFPFMIDSLETYVVDAETGNVQVHDLATGVRNVAASIIDWMHAEAVRLEVDLTTVAPESSTAAGALAAWSPPDGESIERIVPFDDHSILVVAQGDESEAVYRVSAADPASFVEVYRTDAAIRELAVQPKPNANEPWDRLLAINGHAILRLPTKIGMPERLVTLQSMEHSSLSWSMQPWLVAQSNGDGASALIDTRTGDISAAAPGARFIGNGLGWVGDRETIRFARPGGEIETLAADELGLPGFAADPLIDKNGESFVVAAADGATGFVLVHFRDRLDPTSSRVDVCDEVARPVEVDFRQVFTVSSHDGYAQNHVWNFFKRTHIDLGGPQPLDAPAASVRDRTMLLHHLLGDHGSLAIEKINAARPGNATQFPVRSTVDDGPRYQIHEGVGWTVYDDVDDTGRRAMFSRAWRADQSIKISIGEVTSPARSASPHHVYVWGTSDGVEAHSLLTGRTEPIASVATTDCEFVGTNWVAVKKQDQLTFVSLDAS